MVRPNYDDNKGSRKTNCNSFDHSLFQCADKGRAFLAVCTTTGSSRAKSCRCQFRPDDTSWRHCLFRLHSPFLNGVHECFLNTIKDDGANCKNEYRNYTAIEQRRDIERTTAKKSMPKCFNNGGHRVGENKPMILFRYGRYGIDNRRCVHHELNSELQ